MEDLKQAALAAGAQTAFSATEAAEGIEALAKAGVSTTDILNGGLNGALDLAAAGGLEVADAAEIAASAMTQFKLEGDKVPHVADLLAAAAGKAQGEVSDMGAALGQAGIVASQTGLTIEETTGALAAFASAGLIGSDAGTSLKTMLQRLNPTSAEAATLMDELGLRAYDSQGKFVGLSEYAGQLQTALGGMSAEQRQATMATLFGSDAIRGASVLYEQGAAGVERWETAVNDAGYAQETAATKLDNLKGDVEALGGAFETALIGAGASANGVLREMVQAATGVVNAYGALPAPMQATATGIAAVTAAAALAGGAFLLAVPKVAAFKSALGDMGPRTQRIGKGLGSVVGVLGGPWGLALAGGVTALGFFARAKAEAAARVDAFTAAIKADSGALGENTRETAAAELEKLGLLEAAENLGISLKTVTDAALGDETAMRAVSAATTAAVAAGVGMEGQLSLTGQAAADLRDGLEQVTGDLDASSEASRRNAEALAVVSPGVLEAAAAQEQLGTATTDTGAAMQEQEKSLADLMAEVQEATGQVLGLRDASRGYEAALDDATEALAQNGATLDTTTEAGRNNEAALDAIASSANAVMKSMVETGAPLDSVSAKLRVQRDALIQAAQRFGMTRAQAVAYADSVLRIPPKATTTVTVTGIESAAQKVAAFKAAVAGIPAYKNTVVTVNQRQGTVVANKGGAGGRVTERADGGWVPGNGGPRADDQLIAASSGEYVVNARSAAQHAALLEAINSGRAFASGGWVSGGRSAGAATAAPSVQVNVAADAGLARAYAEQVADRVVVKQRDALAMAGLL